MPFTLAALKAELLTDPNGYGYMATGGDQTAKADAINLPRVAITVARGVVPSYEVVAATAPAEWALLTDQEQARYTMIVNAGVVDTTSANIIASFAAMFPAGSATRANLLALASRTGSRAEQLFGVGVAVSAVDVGKALAS